MSSILQWVAEIEIHRIGVSQSSPVKWEFLTGEVHFTKPTYDASRCLSGTFLDPIPEYFRDRTLLANAGAQSGGTEGSSSKIKPDNAGPSAVLIGDATSQSFDASRALRCRYGQSCYDPHPIRNGTALSPATSTSVTCNPEDDERCTFGGETDNWINTFQTQAVASAVMRLVPTKSCQWVVQDMDRSNMDDDMPRTRGTAQNRKVWWRNDVLIALGLQSAIYMRWPQGHSHGCHHFVKTLALLSWGAETGSIEIEGKMKPFAQCGNIDHRCYRTGFSNSGYHGT
ncbi:uncharacterized protein F5891DRAFT_980998 [Suillus fuscotomentosus]|uniref:Uncharacterized protein n=1 Tax=Suillus fuscotomentosus TaxID=1912939 RepID=A0AAD4E4C6_9AGAM|nr:uncharacterized protein F5891DRAFT_980998 [Suillus fuscotomentosus]KAG1899466.1 hypothetical protein F5891DRAFT_980998 [Suillus fuscotomentosus]